MAKLKTIDKISRDYVAAVRNQWNGDLAYTEAVRAQLLKGSFDLVDVLEIVEDGTATNVEKESAHETHFELAGKAASGAQLRVKLSYNPHLPSLCVVEVSAL